MSTWQWLDVALLDAVSADAVAAPRRRRNRNFHPDDAFPAHRLLNAIEPDSYVVPHRHIDPRKDETIICLRGRFGVLLFDAAGAVVGERIIGAGGPCCGVDISSGCYHTLIALDLGSVIFEAKAGPFAPLGADEIAPWAPAEGSADAPAYLALLRDRFL